MDPDQPCAPDLAHHRPGQGEHRTGHAIELAVVDEDVAPVDDRPIEDHARHEMGQV